MIHSFTLYREKSVNDLTTLTQWLEIRRNRPHAQDSSHNPESINYLLPSVETTLIIRFWIESSELVIQHLNRFLIESDLSDTSLHLSIRIPSYVNNDSASSIKNLIAEAILNYMAMKWFAIVAPDKAFNYESIAEKALGNCLKNLLTHTPPSPPCVIF